MSKILLGLLLILAGLALSYFGWRASTLVGDIEDQEEWEDAVYGTGGGASEMGWLGITVGALLVIVGAVVSLGSLYSN
jgi:hypothetical protein